MSIPAACDKCGYEYVLPDKLAGKKAKCKICQAVFVVPQPECSDEISGSGSPIHRYQEREKGFELAIADGDNLEQISEHIAAHLGTVDIVWHELISDLVHIDVHWVKPTSTRPFHTLITSGMSDKPMTVPPGAEAFRYGEVILSLPPEWPLSNESFKIERNYWPIRWLKTLARFPHEYDSWLALGHTLPNGDPAEPFADNTALCCALLMPPIGSPTEFGRLNINDEKTIHFYAFVPIYREEMELKLDQGLDPLIDKLDAHGVTELLDVQRVNTCAKKRFWWF